jgi:hypothetical protein
MTTLLAGGLRGIGNKDLQDGSRNVFAQSLKEVGVHEQPRWLVKSGLNSDFL